jgi:hypothetical protein
VRTIISEQLGTELTAVSADAKFVDLGADSLDTVSALQLARTRHVFPRMEPIGRNNKALKTRRNKALETRRCEATREEGDRARDSHR